MNNKEIPLRGKSLNQAKLQVAGEFQCGDEHPNFEGLAYYRLDKKQGKQRWITRKTFDIYKKRNRDAQNYKYKNDPNHVKKVNAYRCAYAKDNPEYSSTRTAKRRAKILECMKQISKDQARLIEQYYAYAARLTQKLNSSFHVDHIIPLSRGGKHEPNNLQVVPAKWNLRKNNRNTEKWQPSPI